MLQAGDEPGRSPPKAPWFSLSPLFILNHPAVVLPEERKDKNAGSSMYGYLAGTGSEEGDLLLHQA